MDFAILESEFQRLRELVNISGRIVPGGPQTVGIEQRKSLREDRALAPRSAGIEIRVEELRA